MQAPANSGSNFYDYKGTFSIILLAVYDAQYCFTLLDIGDTGRQNDGGVMANSPFDCLQETGRAGRNGKPAHAHLYLNGRLMYHSLSNEMKMYCDNNEQ